MLPLLVGRAGPAADDMGALTAEGQKAIDADEWSQQALRFVDLKLTCASAAPAVR